MTGPAQALSRNRKAASKHEFAQLRLTFLITPSPDLRDPGQSLEFTRTRSQGFAQILYQELSGPMQITAATFSSSRVNGLPLCNGM
jgi:hypothetical protein